ncbi:16369_t:CDS:2 [Cetraspora pellucida]|uniref:16369_t:CDS:1 n=1 Tax=Cetraspora pellucida TaxID=1433469 RepID=A0A9N9A1U4_9GLOM|nr:16369_t:CDS:2 [Cetraspora pellucida]
MNDTKNNLTLLFTSSYISEGFFDTLSLDATLIRNMSNTDVKTEEVAKDITSARAESIVLKEVENVLPREAEDIVLKKAEDIVLKKAEVITPEEAADMTLKREADTEDITKR